MATRALAVGEVVCGLHDASSSSELPLPGVTLKSQHTPLPRYVLVISSVELRRRPSPRGSDGGGCAVCSSWLTRGPPMAECTLILVSE